MSSATSPRVRVRGPLSALSPDDRARLFTRSTSADPAVRARTAAIMERVRRDGDTALLQLARELDGVNLDQLEVPRSDRRRALDGIAPALRTAMERAAANIAAVHRAFLPQTLETRPEPGVIVGRRPDPLHRVGIYAPGGRAAYPSSVLMGAVPARVAGVSEVVLCSPPGPNGMPSDVVLAAAELARVDRVFALGGAGAVAAMAFGTPTVPRVDRIVGPGNAYVAEAKLQLCGIVAIDSPAGPSELLVVADASANPAIVAHELLAQAEHDPRACVISLALGERVSHAIERALVQLLPSQPRRAIIEESLSGQGAMLWTDDLDEAVAFSNEYAPEHLLLASERADAILPRVRNVGTIFMGETSSVAFGDYMTGANHVLPTGGLARSYSGLSILDFIRWTTYQRVVRSAAAGMAADVGVLADAEALAGHALAARLWEDV